MGLQNLPRILNAKLGKQRILSPSSATETPKGYFSIYVGESRNKRFLVPLSYLRHPSFQALLNLAQDEFGYAHPMGGRENMVQSISLLYFPNRKQLRTLPMYGSEHFLMHMKTKNCCIEFLRLSSQFIMGLQKRPKILHTKQGKQRIISPSSATETPKGYFSIYVGESTMRRYLVPLAYLKHSSFQMLLNPSEDEFGYAHPMGGLTVPCKEETFIELTQDIVKY
ncbi:auxin-responsive protein SAUR72 [Artemisia annua]|uniref:Auxin-responsive protein SAUR72 n=1 Tax=Artemisia annua TaxID=35608 RepID=A0A2U1PTU5_ARTAN|nr:auxin-responsive protein SAUR72 [Artemisia annua]